MVNKILQTLAFILLLTITNLDCFGQTYGPLNQYTPKPLSEFLDSKRSVFKYKTLERFQKDAGCVSVAWEAVLSVGAVTRSGIWKPRI